MGQALVVFPPGQHPAPPHAAVRVLQLGSSAAVCPPGKYLLYMSVAVAEEGKRDGEGDAAGELPDGAAEADLRGVLEMLVDTAPPPPPPPSASAGTAAAAGGEAAAEGGAAAAAGTGAGEVDTEAAAVGAAPLPPPPQQPGAFSGAPKPRLLWCIFYR